jgi:hypothetical protein
MARVRLRGIVSSADRAAVMGLRRGPGQDPYLGSMKEIFAEADEEQRAMPRPWAVHDAETGALAGFPMISDNIPQPMDDDLIGPYYLWKLLIDHRSQPSGYGSATLAAIAGYLRYGFADTGRVMQGENILALDLVRNRERHPARPLCLDRPIAALIRSWKQFDELEPLGHRDPDNHVRRLAHDRAGARPGSARTQAA